MGVRRLEDLVAYQLAVEFKLAVYGLLKDHPAAVKDLRYADQLREAASSVEANLAEGWRRYGAAEMAPFVRYAAGSLEESKVRVRDGVHRGHFSTARAEPVLALGDRCTAAITAFLRALLGMTRRRT